MPNNKPQNQKRRPKGLRNSPLLLQVSVQQYTDYREFLQQLYQQLKTSRKSYSYKKFAADLGLSESNVIWQVLTHRRDLSEGSAEKISNHLGLTLDEKKHFLLIVKHNNSRSPDVRETCMKELVVLKANSDEDNGQEKVLEYYEEWYHPVIREMVGLDEFHPDPNWINERLFLKITPRRIEKSLELLRELGLIQYDSERQRFIQTGNQVMPDRKVQALAAIRYHQKACEIAKESVSGVAAHRRDLNVLILSISDETAEKLKKVMIEACIEAMKLENATEKKDQVYQVNMQLFALTR